MQPLHKFGVPEEQWDVRTASEEKRIDRRTRERRYLEMRRLAYNSGTWWQKLKRWLDQPAF
jgi:hypothetical protein